MTRLPFSRLRTVVIVQLFCAVAFAATVSGEEPLRTWTDAGDRYRVEARLVGHEGETVRLEQADGRIIEIELAKLSEADRAYVATYDAGNPFLRGMQKRDGEAKPTPKPVEPSNSPAPAIETMQAGAIDWSGVPLIRTPLQAELPALKVGPAAAGPELSERAIALPAMKDTFDGATGLIVDSSTGTAAFSSSLSTGREPSTTVVAVDLATGETIGTIVTSASYRLLAWDPAAKRVLMASRKRGPRDAQTLEMWLFGPGRFAKTLVAEPEDERGRHTIEWGAFFSGDRFASLSSAGRFAVWSLESGKPVATNGPDGVRAAAASPDGKYLALAIGDGVTFLDVEVLAQAGRLRGDLNGVDAVAFSPDGKLFAARTSSKARVWKTEDFSQVAEVSCGQGEAFLFADAGRLYSAGRLVDVETGCAIVQIAGFPAVASSGGGYVWLCAEDRFPRTRSLVSIPALPADAIGQLVATAPQPRVTLLRETESVRLDLSALPEGVARDSARTGLEKVVDKSRRPIEENASAVLVASMDTGKEQIYQYTKYKRRDRGSPLVGPVFGPGLGPLGGEIEERRELKIAPAILKLELIRDGKTLWSETRSQLPRQLQNLPPAPVISASLSVPEGKTVDDVVKEIETPNYERFDEFELPVEILEPETLPRPILGIRRLTTTGLQ